MEYGRDIIRLPHKMRGGDPGAAETPLHLAYTKPHRPGEAPSVPGQTRESGPIQNVLDARMSRLRGSMPSSEGRQR